MVTVCNFVWSGMLGGLCQKYAVVAALMNSGLEARKCQKRRRLSTASHFLNKQVHKVSTIRTNTYLSGWSMLKSNALRIHLLNVISVTLAGLIGLGTDQLWSAICVSLPTLTGNFYRCAECAGSAWRSSLHTYSRHDPKQHKTAQVGDPSPTSTIKSETWHIVALGILPEIVVNSCVTFFLSWAGWSFKDFQRPMATVPMSRQIRQAQSAHRSRVKKRTQTSYFQHLTPLRSLKDFTWWLTRSFSTFLRPCSQQRRSVWPMCSATSALQTSLLRWPHIFLLHSSQVASNIQTCQSDSSSMKNLSFRLCEVVAWCSVQEVIKKESCRGVCAKAPSWRGHHGLPQQLRRQNVAHNARSLHLSELSWSCPVLQLWGNRLCSTTLFVQWVAWEFLCAPEMPD